MGKNEQSLLQSLNAAVEHNLGKIEENPRLESIIKTNSGALSSDLIDLILSGALGQVSKSILFHNLWHISMA